MVYVKFLVIKPDDTYYREWCKFDTADAAMELCIKLPYRRMIIGMIEVPSECFDCADYTTSSRNGK